jgi:hypothetical protein
MSGRGRQEAGGKQGGVLFTVSMISMEVDEWKGEAESRGEAGGVLFTVSMISMEVDEWKGNPCSDSPFKSATLKGFLYAG